MHDISEFMKLFKEMFDRVYNPVRVGIVAQARDYRWSWCEEEVASATDGDWCLRRVVQIGAGVVFGDEAFVLATAFALGDRFHSGGVGARPVGDVGWSTHGWRLAAAARRICRRNMAETRQK